MLLAPVCLLLYKCSSQRSAVSGDWKVVADSLSVKQLEKALPFSPFRVLPKVAGEPLKSAQVYRRSSATSLDSAALILTYGGGGRSQTFEVLEALRKRTDGLSEANIDRLMDSGLPVEKPSFGDDCLYFSASASVDVCITVHKGLIGSCTDIWKAFTVGIPGLPFKWCR